MVQDEMLDKYESGWLHGCVTSAGAVHRAPCLEGSHSLMHCNCHLLIFEFVFYK